MKSTHKSYPDEFGTVRAKNMFIFTGFRAAPARKWQEPSPTTCFVQNADIRKNAFGHAQPVPTNIENGAVRRTTDTIRGNA